MCPNARTSAPSLNNRGHDAFATGHDPSSVVSFSFFFPSFITIYQRVNNVGRRQFGPVKRSFFFFFFIFVLTVIRVNVATFRFRGNQDPENLLQANYIIGRKGREKKRER